jgi:pyoverdine/dityrosine biosynthesis protein Dit1
VLPAFPAKSPNPGKTLGSLPDYGEVLALRRLDETCARITQLYPPGACLTICSDGRVFSDLVLVSDRAVDEYGRGVAAIIADYGLKHLRTYSLDDAFTDHPSHDEMRRRLVQEHAESLAQLRDRIKQDAEALALFNGIHRFLFEDWQAVRPEAAPSRTKMRLLTREVAQAVIRRSNAWSRLVEQRFPDGIRLSIHPQPLQSRKIGVRLLPSPDRWRTPWHAVTLFDGQAFSLVPRTTAEGLGAAISYADGKYPYYVNAG